MDVAEFRRRKQRLAVGDETCLLGHRPSGRSVEPRAAHLGPESLDRGDVRGPGSAAERHLEGPSNSLLGVSSQGHHPLGERAGKRHDLGAVEEQQTLRRHVRGVAAAADE